MIAMIKRFIDDRAGATAIEYGLLVGLLAVIIAASLNNLGTALWNRLQLVSNALS
jgi:pilus assembly protein Flp/PilA